MANESGVLTLDLGPNGVFTFHTADEINKWVQAEVEIWGFLSGHQPPTNQVYRPPLKSLRQAVPKSLEDRQQWESFEQQAKVLFGKILHHDSPRGRLVIALKAASTAAASAAAAFFAKQIIEHQEDPEAKRGMLLAASYELGPEALVNAPKVIDDLRNTVQTWLAAAKSDFHRESLASADSRRAVAEFQSKINKEMEAAQAETKTALENVTREHKDALASATNGFNNSIATYNKTMADLTASTTEAHEGMTKANADKMQAIEKAYEEQLALHESVEYWRTKKKTHSGRSVYYGIAFAASLALSAVILGLVISAPWSDEPFLPREVDWSKFPLNRVVIVSLLVTGLIWIIRTLARLFFSNLHLYTDADERVVMVTTYLALMKEDKAIKDDDRKLVIETLFRRTSTGIVKEDANPPLLVNMLSKGG